MLYRYILERGRYIHAINGVIGGSGKRILLELIGSADLHLMVMMMITSTLVLILILVLVLALVLALVEQGSAAPGRRLPG